MSMSLNFHYIKSALCLPIKYGAEDSNQLVFSFYKRLSRFMKKSKQSAYHCSDCGALFPKWMGQCTQCQSWNTVVDRPGARASVGDGLRVLSEISSAASQEKWSTQIEFLDRVLSGGCLPGQVLLLAGQPGTGKSTLLFQLFSAQKHKKLLYVSAEESASQVARRFKKKAGQENIFILTENQISVIIETAQKLKPDMIAVDSIQMILSEDLEKSRGGMSAVREVSEQLVALGKSLDIPVWIVGHVTKDGDIAGPKTLEHLVDTVLLFSNAEDPHLRILQTQKHRFGVSGEIAVLEMSKEGLKEVPAGENFWIEDHGQSLAGCAFAPVVLGSRVYCVEVQALCVNSYFPSPRRSTSGFDINRLHLLLAVLEKQLKFPFSQQDVYLNVVGGMKVVDPALDLAVAAALVSAFTECPVDAQKIYCGELGLTGELRRVSAITQRIKAAAQIKKQIFVGSKRLESVKESECHIQAVGHIREALWDLLDQREASTAKTAGKKEKSNFLTKDINSLESWS